MKRRKQQIRTNGSIITGAAEPEPDGTAGPSTSRQQLTLKNSTSSPDIPGYADFRPVLRPKTPPPPPPSSAHKQTAHNGTRNGGASSSYYPTTTTTTTTVGDEFHSQQQQQQQQQQPIYATTVVVQVHQNPPEFTSAAGILMDE